MVEALLDGLLRVLQPNALLYMMLGVFIGFWVGILPGLGGTVTLALMLPFVYGMEPVQAFAFLLGMHSVVATTGDLTSILFGIPGEGLSAALVLDGYAMTKRGEAGRALGANLMSSLIGALVGAAALAASIPVVRPLVLSFGAPELFMLAVMGIAFIASLSGRGARGLARGVAAGALGLLVSSVGQDPQAGILRYTFGQLYLWSGIDIVPAVVGLFALPEILDLMVRRTSIAATAPTEKLTGVWEGVRDCFRHFGLTLRCSLIGAFIGIMPGLGGGVAQWMSYGHAVQSAKTAEERARFGKGDVRGVVGPGAANNSKEGGALIPTVAFGVPGSSAMAVLLGGFFLTGLVPGPDMLTRYLPVTYSMVWTLVLANVVTVALCFPLLPYLARLTTIRATRLVPFLLLLVFVGAYTSNNSWGDILVAVAFGILGYAMVRFGWPRAPLVLGLVLGDIAERYLWISVARYGWDWLGRPGVAVLILLTVSVLLVPFLQEWKQRRAGYAFREAAHAD
ncbi:MAG: tripartite tricarboxylate transporter permease [Armatimonadota bacterium]|nr:tripartite tricarboxylate transporter permease [Armatimonadota bacterium]MDW8155896.1 tripartite tricarboxylate transporter permease [Armatimonadota bacterium]